MKRIALTLAMLMAVSPALAQGKNGHPIVAVPADQAQTVSVLTGLAGVQSQVLADLQNANAQASTPLPTQTAAMCEAPATWNSSNSTCSSPEVYDPLGAMCFPAAIQFVSNLPSPVAFPEPGAGAGLISAAEHVRILALTAKQQIQSIASIGYPTYLKAACGGWIADNAAVGGSITVFLAALLPK